MLLLSLNVFSSDIFSSSIPEEITESLKKGDAKGLSKYFNTNIEMAILNKEGIYSKSQAEQVLKNFFDKYPAKKFQFIHTGGIEGSNYAIGEYESNNAKFRITIYLKNNNKNSLIHQLRIQHDNN